MTLEVLTVVGIATFVAWRIQKGVSKVATHPAAQEVGLSFLRRWLR